MKIIMKISLLALVSSLSMVLSQIDSGFGKCHIKNIGKFPIISPCFKCSCRNESDGEVCQFKHQKCPHLSCDLREYDDSTCCKPCKSCVVNGKIYQHKETWKDKIDNCTLYQCNAGVVSNVHQICDAKCPNPIYETDQCCPMCPGCVLNGTIIKEGEIVENGFCRSCLCKNGLLMCYKQACPYLHCSNQIPGKCCPRCRAVRIPTYVSVSEQTCWFQGNQLEHKQIHQLDKCTKCQCRNATVLCIPERCIKDDSCPEKDLILATKHCCPICSHKIFCKYMGKSYKNLEKWYLPGCAECQCINGTNQCRKQICPSTTNCQPGYRASYIPGSCCLVCLKDTQSCIAYGDPHYQTFDGKAFSYQGVCKYTLAKDCGEDESFSIVARNSGRYTNFFSWIKSITFIYLNTTISLLQNYKVKINGNLIPVPYAHLPVLDIRKSKRYIYVYTQAGISLKWDGDNYIQVSLPEQYKSKVCGLCGNYNDDASDDFELPNGVLVNSAKEFGDYWRQTLSRACRRKSRMVDDRSMQTCQGVRLFSAHRICRRIFSEMSIRSCRWSVPTTTYFQDCVTDVCHCPFSVNKMRCECGAVRGYYERCVKDVPALKWNKKDECDSSCTGGSYYTSCSCQKTCQSFQELCGTNCVPGCQCPAGFAWHVDKCVIYRKCPK